MALLNISTWLPACYLGRRALRVGLLCFAAFLAGQERMSALEMAVPEYQIKAVFLFNFAQFVTWPPRAFPQASQPLVIGILGDDPFGSYLEETVHGEKIDQHPMVIRHYRRVGEIKACHILFISRSETGQLPQILAGLQGRSILTVGDATGFARAGGMIRMATQKHKVRLEVNMQAARAANLTISSKLLRLAEIVGSGKD